MMASILPLGGMPTLNNGQSRNTSSRSNRRHRLSDGPSFDESVSQSDSSNGDGSCSESSSVFSDCEYSTYGEDDDDDDYDDKTNDDSVVDASVSEVGSSRRRRSGSESSVFSGCEVDAEEEYYEDFDGSRSCVSSSVFSDSELEIEDEDEVEYESSSTPFFGIQSMTDAIKNMFSNIGPDDLFASDGDDGRRHENEIESVSLKAKNNDASHDDDKSKSAKAPVASDDSKADGSPNKRDLQPVALDNQKDNGSHKSERGMVALDGFEDNGYHQGEIISVLWISQKDNDHHENEIELVASDDYEDNGSHKSNTVSVLWHNQEGNCFIQSAKERVSSDDDDDDDEEADEEADIRHIADMLSVSWDENDGQYDSEKELDAWFIDQLANEKGTKQLEEGSSWYDESPSKGGTAPSTHVSESSRDRSSQKVKHSISSPASDDSCFDGCDSSDSSHALEDAGFAKEKHPRDNAAFPSVIHSVNKIDTPFDESYDGDWSVGELHGDDDNSLSFLDDDFNRKERTVALPSSLYKIPDDITFTKSKTTRTKKPSSPRFRVTVVERDAPTKSAPIIRASAEGRVVTSSCIADDECSI